MKFFWATFVFAIGSSAIPVLNMEIYIVAAYAASSWGALELAALSSLGQNIGKLVWYYAARGTISTPWMTRQLQKPGRQETFERWKTQIQGRPWFSGAVTFVSAAIGFPPFFVIAMVAGSLRMNVVVFFLAGLFGRTLFFWALLAGAGLIVR